MNTACYLIPGLLACSLTLPALETMADREFLASGEANWSGWRFEAGLPSAITSVDLSGIEAAGVGPFDQDLEADWAPGIHLGLAWTRSAYYWEEWGWRWSVGLAWDRHRGELSAVTSTGAPGGEWNGAVILDALSVTLDTAMVFRWDFDRLRALPRFAQFELGPVAGLGVARAELDGSGSDPGFYYRLGFNATMSVPVDPDWRIGLIFGYERAWATVSWDNVDEGRFNMDGFTIAVTLFMM